MKTDDKRMLWKILAQTETVTITAQTKHDLSMDEAREEAVKTVINPKASDRYFNHVILPLATEEDWNAGKINFCPRCGSHFDEGQDPRDFECWDCNCHGFIELELDEQFD